MKCRLVPWASAWAAQILPFKQRYSVRLGAGRGGGGEAAVLADYVAAYGNTWFLILCQKLHRYAEENAPGRPQFPFLNPAHPSRETTTSGVFFCPQSQLELAHQLPFTDKEGICKRQTCSLAFFKFKTSRNRPGWLDVKLLFAQLSFKFCSPF